MSDLTEAQALLDQIKAAAQGSDDRALWLAWKRGYRARFWKAFSAMGPGQVCAQQNVPYEAILKRITSYELGAGRNSSVDEAELASEGVPPSMPLSTRGR